MRMWRPMVAVASATILTLIETIHAQSNGCPPGQFSVSVLDNPIAQCLTSRPCSGVYGFEGLLDGVGSCPGNTGCALLPHNPSVMGCVIAGRADVSYVNPDGSLTRGGQVISGPPSKNGGNNEGNNGNNNNNNNNNGGNDTNNNTHNNNNGDNGGNNSTDDTDNMTPGTTQPAKDTTSSDGSKNLSPSTSSSGSMMHAVTPDPLIQKQQPTPSANKSSLDDINGDKKSKEGENTTNGMGLGSIVAIILGCLAILAFIAGVFFLRKNKEQMQQTPPGGLEEYGTGCVTPKENVLLL